MVEDRSEATDDDPETSTRECWRNPARLSTERRDPGPAWGRFRAPSFFRGETKQRPSPGVSTDQRGPPGRRLAHSGRL